MPNLTCERHWQFEHWELGWQKVAAVSDWLIVLENGQGVAWRQRGNGFVPDENVHLRYSIPLREPWCGTMQMMPWKPGDMPLLLLDAGLPDVADAVRQALAGRR